MNTHSEERTRHQVFGGRILTGIAGRFALNLRSADGYQSAIASAPAGALRSRTAKGPRQRRSVIARMVLLSVVTVLSGLLYQPPPAFAKALDLASFLVPDGQARKVFGYNADGGLVGSFSLNSANSRPSSVSSDGATVYVLDSGRRKIYQYDNAGSLDAVSAELRRPDGGSLSAPGGMAIDGDELWVVDRGVGRIFRYSLSEAFSATGRLSAQEEIWLSPDNARAEGLAIDETWLYVLDEADRQVYGYIRDYAGPLFASRVMLQVDGSSLRAPAGITIVDTQVFIVDRSLDKVFEYDRDSLFSLGEPLPAVDEFQLPRTNGDARGLHHVFEGTQLVAEDAFVKEVVELINEERKKFTIEQINKFRQELNQKNKAEWEAENERRKQQNPPLPPLPAPTPLADLTVKKLKELHPDPKLERAAKTHNQLQLRNGKISHQFDKERPLAKAGADNDRLDAVEYAWSSAAENVGYGERDENSTPAKIVKSWMDSLGHKVNILSDTDDVGAAYDKNAYGLVTDPDKHFWTVVFAKPAS